MDRDEILVPSGWDSWGKIKILRERFNPEVISAGWDHDMRGATDIVDTNSSPSTLRGYEDAIVDLDSSSRVGRLNVPLIFSQLTRLAL